LADLSRTTAVELASAIRARKVSSTEAVDAAIAVIERLNPKLLAFCTPTLDAARADARAIEQKIARGEPVGPLAGVPISIKDLILTKGVRTTGGCMAYADLVPEEDDVAVERVRAAGAIVLGKTNVAQLLMFIETDNPVFGRTNHPQNTARSPGGSSGGEGALLAAGASALGLGTDLGGSVRVPAAFCGVFGLKPTYGRVSRVGTVLFAESFDHVGPFARSVSDLAMAFDVLHGPDPRDPVCSTLPPFPTMPDLERGCDTLRIAVATDYFARQGYPEAFGAVRRVADALKVTREVVIPEAARARGAAYIITACEGGQLHLPDLKSRPQDFDPLVVERFMAGALLPSAWYAHAQRFRSWFRDQVRALFETVDVILAPTTPCPATEVGQDEIVLDGVRLPARPTVGIFTQPLSFIGLPIVSVPVQRPGKLPLGVQVIAAPYQEANALRVARMLEHMGVVSAPVTRPS